MICMKPNYVCKEYRLHCERCIVMRNDELSWVL